MDLMWQWARRSPCCLSLPEHGEVRLALVLSFLRISSHLAFFVLSSGRRMVLLNCICIDEGAEGMGKEVGGACSTVESEVHSVIDHVISTQIVYVNFRSAFPVRNLKSEVNLPSSSAERVDSTFTSSSKFSSGNRLL